MTFYRDAAATARGEAITKAIDALAAVDAGDFEAAFLATQEANWLAGEADWNDALADALDAFGSFSTFNAH